MWQKQARARSTEQRCEIVNEKKCEINLKFVLLGCEKDCALFAWLALCFRRHKMFEHWRACSSCFLVHSHVLSFPVFVFVEQVLCYIVSTHHIQSIQSSPLILCLLTSQIECCQCCVDLQCTAQCTCSFCSNVVTCLVFVQLVCFFAV